ncbi:unnamed protein product [Spirodela intermedia]|uniref:Uncharacterized protein n=1 Tax=Spirodela intermedia TaxID=51605 RepID=A0A7I8KD78_SPIIN|nr:unnamed protein product [Spirodela intermedia]
MGIVCLHGRVTTSNEVVNSLQTMMCNVSRPQDQGLGPRSPWVKALEPRPSLSQRNAMLIKNFLWDL